MFGTVLGGLGLLYALWRRFRTPKNVVCYYFVFRGGIREEWIKREYKTDEEREYEQDQIFFIALDPVKNEIFRSVGVESIIGIKDDTQFFNVVLNKNGLRFP